MAIKDELLELLRTDPEARDAARREILTEDLFAVPARMDLLTARVESLAGAQQRTEEQVRDLAAAQLRTEAQVRELAGAQLRTEAQVRELAAAQQRTEQQVRDLAAAQLRTEERLGALVTEVRNLVVAQRESLERLDRLAEWQRGEQGRRDGERYERDTVRHAGVIFGGGRDVMQRPDDLERIRRALDPLMTRPDLTAEDDPFLADLLWLKGGRIIVVEVSRQVDLSDMQRAERRAELLRSAGLTALGIVIGRDWASEEAEHAACGRSVDWRVGDGASVGYLELRRAPA